MTPVSISRLFIFFPTCDHSSIFKPSLLVGYLSYGIFCLPFVYFYIGYLCLMPGKDFLLHSSCNIWFLSRLSLAITSSQKPLGNTESLMPTKYISHLIFHAHVVSLPPIKYKLLKVRYYFNFCYFIFSTYYCVWHIPGKIMGIGLVVSSA